MACPLTEVATNKMRREVVVTGSSGPPVYFRWPTKGCILSEEFYVDAPELDDREIGKVDPPS